jgi:hypothetical protein
LDNKEETTYKKVKERKAQEKHKRVIGYVKNTANQKATQKLLAAYIPASLGDRGRRNLHLKVVK